MAEIVYRQMPAPRDIPPKIPAPRAKIRMQKPQSGGEFSVQIPGGARGGMVMAKIDNCIIHLSSSSLTRSNWVFSHTLHDQFFWLKVMGCEILSAHAQNTE